MQPSWPRRSSCLVQIYYSIDLFTPSQQTARKDTYTAVVDKRYFINVARNGVPVTLAHLVTLRDRGCRMSDTGKCSGLHVVIHHTRPTSAALFERDVMRDFELLKRNPGLKRRKENTCASIE